MVIHHHCKALDHYQMKIRILENSVRLRLTQSEVEQLAKTGRVRQTINFGNSALHYSIQKASVDDIQAIYESNEILISIPTKTVDDWSNSDQISLQETVAINNKETLKILVEKDFKCLTVRAGEDESDMFPNPDTSH